jgi:hypothetical protein
VDRRSFLFLASFLAATHSLAQRPANPIVRPRPPRPDGPLIPGRFPRESTGGTSGQAPGVFIVRDVSDRNNTLRLSDADGRTEDVLVDPDVYDITTLKSGDEVMVDFFVEQDSKAPLRAASVWPK